MRRRSFLKKSGWGAAGALAASAVPSAATAGSAADETIRPIVLISKGKVRAARAAMKRLTAGADALDAVIAAVNRVEEDPDDITVGYGGLPNERGVVELDSSVMHGPTASGGAVAALRNIKYPSRVARLVMEQTDHILLVGQGALEFARAQGFAEQNLLTEKARRIWLHWKQSLSDKDDWIAPPEPTWSEDVKQYLRTYGTVHCSAVDRQGNLSGVTSTSGLFMKMPGRVGDSPLIGCGLYVDNDHGACGSTGRGEAVILSNGSHSVIEHLRRGSSPEQAALKTLEWIAGHNRIPRLQAPDGRPNFNVVFYVLDKKGRHAAAAIWSGPQYTVHDGTRIHTLDAAWLYKRK
ncbi:MAG: N(4)-(beta-N-acetylglucosaminyl)-L-asparaginase [Acidobacteriota bacterium]